MASSFGGKIDKREKAKRKQWLFKHSMNQCSKIDDLLSANVSENKIQHYLLKFDCKNLDQQIMDNEKSVSCHTFNVNRKMPVKGSILTFS
jgi:hypothetical protein